VQPGTILDQVTLGIGIVAALLILVAVLTALWWSWRQPPVGLGLLVAGMAFHSFLLMVLLRLSVPYLLVRLLQGWKEILLALLTVIAVMGLWRDRKDARIGLLLRSDWVAIAFAVLSVLYFVLPGSLLHSDANLAQRLVGFRLVILIPLLYFLGRRFGSATRAELLTILGLCIGAGAAVAVFGVVELWLVPTRTWLDWGVNLYTGFLGFTYHGPKGLPENFFLTLPDGTLVRRMVSTYISPLGIAYTGVLLVPMGLVLIQASGLKRTTRWIAAAGTTLVVLSMMLSVTRLAILSIVGEVGVLVFLLRRWWIGAVLLAVSAAAAAALLIYPSIGPISDQTLQDVPSHHPQSAVSGQDSSAQEHYGFLVLDIKVDLQHPLGLGTGASTVRYGKLVGTGESAVLGMFGDLGVVGGLLYLALYAFALWNGFRAYSLLRRDSLEQTLPLTALVGGLGLLPITVTSDLWGDLSVTFLFWWVAGATATIAARLRRESRAGESNSSVVAGRHR
jgi:hypothetical protein